MGRQRLYHTAEEKLVANRAKSKRHYEKYALFLFIHHTFYIHNSLEIKFNQQTPAEKVSENKSKEVSYYWPLSTSSTLV